MKNLMKKNKLIIEIIHFLPLSWILEFNYALSLFNIIELITKDFMNKVNKIRN